MSGERQGASFIEVLLALAVLGVAVVPLVSTFSSGSLASHQIVEMTRALQIATSELERLRGAGFRHASTLPASSPIPGADMPRHFEGAVERSDIVAGELIQITIRVRWRLSVRLVEKVELATFFADPHAR